MTDFNTTLLARQLELGQLIMDANPVALPAILAKLQTGEVGLQHAIYYCIFRAKPDWLEILLNNNKYPELTLDHLVTAKFMFDLGKDINKPPSDKPIILSPIAYVAEMTNQQPDEAKKEDSKKCHDQLIAKRNGFLLSKAIKDGNESITIAYVEVKAADQQTLLMIAVRAGSYEFFQNICYCSDDEIKTTDILGSNVFHFIMTNFTLLPEEILVNMLDSLFARLDKMTDEEADGILNQTNKNGHTPIDMLITKLLIDISIPSKPGKRNKSIDEYNKLLVFGSTKYENFPAVRLSDAFMESLATNLEIDRKAPVAPKNKNNKDYSALYRLEIPQLRALQQENGEKAQRNAATMLLEEEAQKDREVKKGNKKTKKKKKANKAREEVKCEQQDDPVRVSKRGSSPVMDITGKTSPVQETSPDQEISPTYHEQQLPHWIPQVFAPPDIRDLLLKFVKEIIKHPEFKELVFQTIGIDGVTCKKKHRDVDVYVRNANNQALQEYLETKGSVIPRDDPSGRASYTNFQITLTGSNGCASVDVTNYSGKLAPPIFEHKKMFQDLTVIDGVVRTTQRHVDDTLKLNHEFKPDNQEYTLVTLTNDFIHVIKEASRWNEIDAEVYRFVLTLSSKFHKLTNRQFLQDFSSIDKRLRIRLKEIFEKCKELKVDEMKIAISFLEKCTKMHPTDKNVKAPRSLLKRFINILNDLITEHTCGPSCQ